MNNTTLYNVYIVKYENDIASAIIGHNLTKEKAEQREMAGLMRCNENFGVYSVEVLSEADKKYTLDLMK